MAPYFAVGEHVLHQRVDEGMLVVQTRTLSYIELDAVGADMWEAVITAGDLASVVSVLQDSYDVDATLLEDDLGHMVDKWVELGLGTVDEASPQPGYAEDRDATVAELTLAPADLYLNLMVKALCGLTSGAVPNLGKRLAGFDVPVNDPAVFTLIGTARLRNIKALMQRVLDDDIPGDIMECGVWRGGASIFMRAVLAARQVSDRIVWVVDSFDGLPEVPADGHPLDQKEWARFAGCISASEAQVRANFEVFDLLDDQVRFLAGWFEESLPTAEVQQLAVLRLDADLYSSTMTALTHLYPKLAPGGFVIIDDYFYESCRQSVHDYLDSQGLTVELHPIDWTGVWWRKPL
jgi:hypothetical protein